MGKTSNKSVPIGDVIVTLPRPPESCTISTPSPLARAMVRVLGDRRNDEWLDPCVGEGVFLRALAEMDIEPRRITAVDIERTPGSADALARTTRGVDFFTWAGMTKSRFNKIVANPPYVALAKLDPALQNSAISMTRPNGYPISLGSNYWYAFVCASLMLLQPGGDICFVLPAAWDYADYAAPLRDSITKRFAHFEIHRSRKPLFDSVQDGSVVIIGCGYGQPGGEVVRADYDSAEALISALQSKQIKTSQSVKVVKPTLSPLFTWSNDARQLRDVLDIRLGGVTGDAQYFLLTETERRERGLPVECVRPVLSKARHLVSGEITRREWKALRDNDERVWLFDPPPYTLRNSAVRAYIKLAPASGGCRRDRYKIKIRSPWYRTPLPKHVDGFISGMTQLGPWICLRAMPRLTATNTLYTVRFRGLLSQNEKAVWALSLLTSQARQAMQSIGRIYPEGLLKHEPGDLLDLLLPIPRKVNGARAWYLKAVKALLCGDIERCQDMADYWFEGDLRLKVTGSR